MSLSDIMVFSVLFGRSRVRVVMPGEVPAYGGRVGVIHPDAGV